MPRHKITIDELDKFEIDEDNNIYWQGSRLKTTSEVRLEWWLNIPVILGSIGGFGVFVIELCKIIN